MTDEIKIEIVKTIGNVAGSAIFGWAVVNLFCGRPVSKKEIHNLATNLDNLNASYTEFKDDVIKCQSTTDNRFKAIEKKLSALAEVNPKLNEKFKEIDNE